MFGRLFDHIARGDRRRVGENADACRARHQLMQQLEALYVELAGKDADPGDVATGPGQAADKPAADHIVGDADDWEVWRDPLHRSDRRIAGRDDCGGLFRYEPAYQRRQTLIRSFGSNKMEPDIAPVFLV